MIQEELIRFESLKDIHSRVTLTEVVNGLLTKYNIAYQVISIITDNVSNNRTIMTEINGYLEEAFTNIRFLDRQI